jgi:hypothetical protein
MQLAVRPACTPCMFTLLAWQLDTVALCGQPCAVTGVSVCGQPCAVTGVSVCGQPCAVTGVCLCAVSLVL